MSLNPKTFIAPFVKNARFPDLETSIKVADKALDLYTRLKSNYQITPNGGSCVGMAAISLGVMNDTILQNLLQTSGQNMKMFIKSVNEIRTLLNVLINISFTSLAEECNLPTRYATTANEIYNGLKERDPDDIGLQRPAVYAGVLLCIAVARGHKKDDVLQNLSRKTYSDPVDILGVEKMVKEFAGGKYGLKAENTKESLPPPTRVEVSPELKAATNEIMQNMQKDKNKKKKQTTLSFT
ncbi:hypothetical protein TVAG_084480 [Trichomonas vaginalis G3]|uniref:Uncharacterized protein n=1 Tax=Trichomonas vaginalis (strain ATCC PRA-98 / G3) TaxID=412133 RepID=A2G0V1_TRIV3|nr:hypothetical protein TVAGG3_0293890 [Trichomonas vaginalis G3]EAX89217.1 hypothetical protein TVAG_084480 [Trichomonas vaginalis G3]KAI5527473.1 hypothetical protein TVAGG3_0293890 [Trichomonas vaginalis G3]|eukprot:XP_001302147.1 hypothetical protein [Trichomonas vaginalis G3]